MNTKRILSLFMALILVFGLIPITASATDNITVIVNGETVTFRGQSPVIVDNRTLVPVRGVFEELGFEVGWDGDTHQATLTNDNYVVVLTIGNANFTINNQNHTLDVPAQIINGSTMLPIRAVVEGVGYGLDWNGTTRTISISRSSGDSPVTSETAVPVFAPAPVQPPAPTAPTFPSPEWEEYVEPRLGHTFFIHHSTGSMIHRTASGEQTTWRFIDMSREFESRETVHSPLTLSSESTRVYINTKTDNVLMFSYVDSNVRVLRPAPITYFTAQNGVWAMQQHRIDRVHTPTAPAIESGQRIIPQPVNWQEFLRPEIWEATPAHWRNFTYNDILNIPPQYNHGNNVWSHIEDYHRGDGLILRAAELYFDRSGAGLDRIRQYRRDHVESYLELTRIRLEINESLATHLPDRGEKHDPVRRHNFWSYQPDVDYVLGLIPGLLESDVNVILFYNDGGHSYEPGMVTFQGRQFWVIMVDPLIISADTTGDRARRGVHDMIQQLLYGSTMNTMEQGGSISYMVPVTVESARQNTDFIRQRGSPFENWGWFHRLALGRNFATYAPPEHNIPVDDRPLWSPQGADGVYGSARRYDWAKFYLSENMYYRAWFLFQPRTVALDQHGNEIDIAAGLVKELRGLGRADTLPARP